VGSVVGPAVHTFHSNGGFTASFTDAGVLDTHTAVWNWGDGSSSTGIITENNGSGTASGSHSYAAAGVYSIVVTVTDDDGGSGQSTLQYAAVYGINVLFDQTRAYQSGSTVPIRIGLLDANGVNVSSASVVVHAVSVVQISSQASTSLDDPGNSNPDFDFRYEAALGRYVFNLKTTGYGTGSYLLNFVVGNSPTIYSVEFQIRQ
jgi:hypothetical protein